MNSIFISSSFKDMQCERDMLRYKALPQINDYLKTNYGQETTKRSALVGFPVCLKRNAASVGKKRIIKRTEFSILEGEDLYEIQT